jgi:hypothetical protein
VPSLRRASIWLAVWLATRALTVCQVAFWTEPHRGFEDVANYQIWAHILTAHGEFPGGPGWQYPPGAGLMMLVPRAVPAGYGVAFIGLMLAVDLIGLVLLARLAERTGRDTGVWVWLLGMPLLGTFALLRFDLVPTVIAIGALVVIHRRPGWFGALVGLGAAIKVWPALLLLGEWDRRRLLRAGIAAAAVVALVFAVSTIAFGDPGRFISHGGGRGLQEEAVATAPWQLAQIFGDPYPRAVQFGAWQIASPTAEDVAAVLRVLTLVALGVSALWWLARTRAIRAGRDDLADPDLSRDFVFAVVLLVVITSPVLSPQYMVWLLGLAAVVLSSTATRLRRPAWIVLGAAVLTTATTGSAALTLLRDLALLAATADAVVSMARVVRPLVVPGTTVVAPRNQAR